jgi:hypothetical protein
MDRLKNWLRSLRAAATSSAAAPASPQEEPAQLRERCRELQERNRWLDEQLKARSERLYELERHYSSEHFKLAESMRNERTERMRSAGASADRDIVLGRYRALQERIAALKARLRAYEEVEDAHFDDAPIVIERPGA